MSMIEIEYGIPLPRERQVYGNNAKYPFKDMKVGGSFLWPYNEGGEPRSEQARRVRNAALAWRKKHDMKVKFTTRVRSNGVRVWRTE